MIKELKICAKWVLGKVIKMFLWLLVFAIVLAGWFVIDFEYSMYKCQKGGNSERECIFLITGD